MTLRRRQFLHLAAGAAAVPAASRIARAQLYPTRPVCIVVGFAAGGGFDVTARLIGQSLSERLDQQFVVENRTGANGNIATEVVVRSPSDGYTLLMIEPSLHGGCRDDAPIGLGDCHGHPTRGGASRILAPQLASAPGRVVRATLPPPPDATRPRQETVEPAPHPPAPGLTRSRPLVVEASRSRGSHGRPRAVRPRACRRSR
jgi:hypothetical protein